MRQMTVLTSLLEDRCMTWPSKFLLRGVQSKKPSSFATCVTLPRRSTSGDSAFQESCLSMPSKPAETQLSSTFSTVMVSASTALTRLLLRIEADETGSQHSFNSKFGCSFDEAKRILQEARNCGSKVVGLSFHVGCAYQDPVIFARTIERAKAIFDMASSIGNTMSVLDVGGGFPGGLRIREKFLEVCEAIRLATDLHFPVSSGVQLLAEPGQFFVTSAYALIVQVIGKRHRDVTADGVKKVQQDVFINESRDNCVSRNLYDYLDVKIWPLQEPLERPCGVPTTVWGGTCNPVDCIERKPLFHVNVGEWLLMDNIGAYSLSRASGFNGLPYPAVHYIAPQENVSALLDILNVSPLRSGYGQPEGVLKRSLLTRWRSEATGCDEQSNLAPAAALPC
ncbi:ornithine decarboxylase-like isoform X3 [Rhipicephalus microplus]|uniref:ornithine decarboxylase-like isoform X3 n=1 Tax=Rhipicephalus microplus TaxID=6941 RepID=UPI003F6C40D4